MVCGVDPLRIYLYKEGLCRLATFEYMPPAQANLSNLYMHLTNYAINKTNENYLQADNLGEGHKRSLSYFFKYLDMQGHNSQSVLHQIKLVIIKTLIAVQPMLRHTYRSCQPDNYDNNMCFEVLGFDIFLDQTLKPYILEVNHDPSFETDTALDFKIKKQLIGDTFKLLQLSYYNRIAYKQKKAESLNKRAIAGKIPVSREERDALKQQAEIKRNAKEMKIATNYQLIFPSEQFSVESVKHFMLAADEVYNETTGKKSVKEPLAEVKQPPKFVARPMPRRKLQTPKTSAAANSEHRALQIINDDTDRKFTPFQ